MTKAVKLGLYGDVYATVPFIKKMIHFWTHILTTPSKEIEPKVGPVQENPELHWISASVTCEEIKGIDVPLRWAPGSDKSTVRQWPSIPV